MALHVFVRSGCDASNWNESQKPSSFAPTSLDTDNWAASMTALGVKEAVLTAKHGCGFAIWPTHAKLPNGTRYPYHSEMDVLGNLSLSLSFCSLLTAPRWTF